MAIDSPAITPEFKNKKYGNMNEQPSFDTNRLSHNTTPFSIHSETGTPTSNGKFIEKSLNDLDDFISERRNQFSEMKRNHLQRAEITNDDKKLIGSPRAFGKTRNTLLPKANDVENLGPVDSTNTVSFNEGI